MDGKKKSHSENKSLMPLCTLSCPLHVDARGYVRLIALNEFEKALELITRDNPLPSVCGSVCTHPCELKCRRGKVDEPVSIRELKGFVSEKLPEITPAKPKGKIPKKVAVVGSGPSGLSCAYFLSQKGYSVTVFEAKPRLGGMLYYGIPDFRLPKDVLEKDIEFIGKSGIEFKTNHAIGRHESIGSLLTGGYDAVYIAAGAQKSMLLGVPGEDLGGVLVGLKFLEDYNAGKRVNLGRTVLVVGGGDVSIDAARCALKCGAKKVKVLYRRSPEEMPASRDEVNAAKRDGVSFEYLTLPLRFLGRDEKIVGVEAIKVKLGEPDESGRSKPVPIPGSEFKLDADSVIVAIRQKPDLSYFAGDGLSVGGEGVLRVDSKTLMTNVPGVFAGGDVVSGPSCIIDAMSYGRQASESIDCYLQGKPYTPKEASSSLSDISEKTVQNIKRTARIPLIPRQYSTDDAVSEALRCLGCGFGASVDSDKCVACLACVRICSYTVPKIVEDKAFIDLNDCQSCGFCFAECPASAISMSDGAAEHFEEKVAAIPIKKRKNQTLLIPCSRANALIEGGKDTPSVSRIVVDCVGRIPKPRMLHLINEGFAGVVIVACDEGMCTHKTGNKVAEKRVRELAATLAEFNMGGRIRFFEAFQLLKLGLNNVVKEIIEEK
jgi:NADPH-dependent glutamate synthase beta subunit-like oxidoreductase/coenzyme F420-reducing hydrogenase delta subunit/ferredoxin